jgi:hypothetical protein
MLALNHFIITSRKIMNIGYQLAVLAGVVWLAGAGVVRAEDVAGKAAGRPFEIFDNMHYAGKPDWSGAGLVPNCVIYGTHAWKKLIEAGQMPDEAAYKELVRKSAAGQPGPIVIDVEYVFLSRTKGTTDEQVKQHFELFIKLAQWAHEAAPGHLVGYYGHGLFPEEPGPEYAVETKRLLAAVDAFFPSLYVYGDVPPAKWQEKLQTLVREARQIAPEKLVYPYLWAQYHEGRPKALKFVPADYVQFQLDQCRASGADGVVFWSGGKPAWTAAMNDAPWLRTVLDFAAAKPVCVEAGKANLPKADPGAKGKFEAD